MKVAVVGSRGLWVENLGDYLPEGTEELISGGAQGIDACARSYAKQKGLAITEIFPCYARYSRAAPLRRNEEIVRRADMVLAFWDGESKPELQQQSELGRQTRQRKQQNLLCRS